MGWRPERCDRIALVPEITILQLIYQQKAYEGHAKDHEFSGTSPWACIGRAVITDTKRTLLHRYWLEMPVQGAGCVVHDVYREDD